MSDNCHERITSEALRRVRAELATAPPLPSSSDERALIADLPFKLDDDLDDLGGATLLIAVRDNDLKGRHSVDLASLALVHGDPNGQREHCLRGEGDDEPNGSERALLACRAFIRERFEQALEGLDAAGQPDPSKRTKLPVYAALRHRVEPALPTFYVRMGQALHTIEDSFTHAYRTADGMKVTVVSNWLREVEGTLDERLHGPPHAGELDHCRDLDELRKLRRMLATDAATETLRAALDPLQNREQKLRTLDGLLDKYLSLQSGCTHENEWCAAPERKYGNRPNLKCALGSAPSDLTPLLLLLWLLAGRGCRRARRNAGVPVALVAGLFTAPGVALADGNDRQSKLERRADDMESRRELTDANGEQLVFGGYAGGAASVDHGAVAFALGARARFRKNWLFGADAEWNPWISDPRVIYNTEHFRPGVFNFYFSGVFRLQLENEAFNLRSSVSLGVSTMLMDLYGAPRGSTGVYGAISPLALEWKMARVPYLVIAPLSIVLPAPQLNGVPFVYAQYRFTVGVELFKADK